MAETKKTKIDDSKMTKWREEAWKNYQKQHTATPKKKTVKKTTKRK